MATVQWTDELKARVVTIYKEGNPTPETSGELIKEIAETIDASPNGVRMVLVQAGAYVKKDSPAAPTDGAKAAGTTGAKRVSKDSAINDLKEAIKAKGAPVDEEILSKLTGKAAVYLLSVINT